MGRRHRHGGYGSGLFVGRGNTGGLFVGRGGQQPLGSRGFFVGRSGRSTGRLGSLLLPTMLVVGGGLVVFTVLKKL